MAKMQDVRKTIEGSLGNLTPSEFANSRQSKRASGAADI